MPPVVLLLLAAGAILHTLWNVLLKTSDDPLATSTRAVSWGLLVATPLLGTVWLLAGRPLPSTGAVGLAAGSAIVELGYFVFLSAAYRRGDLSTVYPIARGTAPILSVASGVLLLGERLHPIALAGALLVVAGIWLVRGPAGSGPAVGFALLTGVAIAAYSTIDRLGVQAAPPWLYAWLLWLFTAVVLWLALLVRGGHGGVGEPRRDVVIGTAMLGTWLMILVALSLAPLAAVAPLREGAVVLTAGWGVFRLRERARAAVRLAGAAAIVAGIVLLAVT